MANPFDPKRICVVAHYAYGAIAGGMSGHVGGVERQTTMLCRWLVRQGLDVRLVTWDEGGQDDENIDGVRVIKMCRSDSGLPGLRFFHPRWTSLNSALSRADADLYYQNCGEYVTGQVAMWCRAHGKSFVYSVANDTDCDPRLPEMKTLREQILYKYGLRRADKVIVQTETQQRMLKRGFDLDSTVLPMPCVGPLNDEYQPKDFPGTDDIRVAWVGRIAKAKRLDLLIEVAQRLPRITFEVAGKPADEERYYKLVERARAVPNIKVLGMIPMGQVAELYRRAFLLCCTSSYEGFPNTFLEAWSHGTPIVATFDPDNLIARKSLGMAAGDVDGIVNGIETMIASPDRWLEMSRNARRYYLENHTIDEVMSRFERLFLDVLERRNGRP